MRIADVLLLLICEGGTFILPYGIIGVCPIGGVSAGILSMTNSYRGTYTVLWF